MMYVCFFPPIFVSTTRDDLLAGSAVGHAFELPSPRWRYGKREWRT